MSVALVRAGTLPLISRGCVLRTCLWLPYGRACGAQVVASSRTRLRRSSCCEQQDAPAALKLLRAAGRAFGAQVVASSRTRLRRSSCREQQNAPAALKSSRAAERACGAQVVASSRTRLRRSTRREQQEILEEDAAVARFVRMFPARAALVPVFKRLLEMKLHRIDQLAVAALDHHLIAAEV